MNTDEVIALLRAACKEAGGQLKWANRHNIAAAFVSDVLARRRKLGTAIPRALKLKRQECYLPIEKDHIELDHKREDD